MKVLTLIHSLHRPRKFNYMHSRGRKCNLTSSCNLVFSSVRALSSAALAAVDGVLFAGADLPAALTCFDEGDVLAPPPIFDTAAGFDWRRDEPTGLALLPTGFRGANKVKIK